VPVVILCGKLEAELAQLDPEEAREFRESLHLRESGLERLVRAGYSLLSLITFFTANEKEARAWTVKSGTKAPHAAGKVHTDMEKGFIKAEVISFQDLLKVESLAQARGTGLIRIEGKDYIVQDGDLMYFRFNP
jgi:ribosome-binding ATPase YchF (GTP1/OBG family)